MHRDPTPRDRAPLDSDSTGYDPREHEHGQHAVTRTTPFSRPWRRRRRRPCLTCGLPCWNSQCRDCQMDDLMTDDTPRPL